MHGILYDLLLNYLQFSIENIISNIVCLVVGPWRGAGGEKYILIHMILLFSLPKTIATISYIGQLEVTILARGQRNKISK